MWSRLWKKLEAYANLGQKNPGIAGVFVFGGGGGI